MLWFGSPEQFDPEHASNSDGAFHAEDTSHQFDQSLGHHQADARTLFTAGLLTETIERLEQLRQFIRRQSRAGVFDTDVDAFRGTRGALHGDRSPGMVVFYCIGEKVDEDLLHPRPIGEDKAWFLKLAKAHGNAV